MTLELYKEVALTLDLPEHQLIAGDIATLVLALAKLLCKERSLLQCFLQCLLLASSRVFPWLM